jgi:hypothetical protein
MRLKSDDSHTLAGKCTIPRNHRAAGRQTALVFGLGLETVMAAPHPLGMDGIIPSRFRPLMPAMASTP